MEGERGMSRLTKDNFKTERAMEGFNNKELAKNTLMNKGEIANTFSVSFRGKDRKITRNKSTLLRFLKYVKIIDGGCWEWVGTKNKSGYGAFHLGRLTRAHRASLFLFRGIKPFDTKLVADHLCRNVFCVNPDHLEMVTSKTNLMRGTSHVAKNSSKTHCPSGHEYKGRNLLKAKIGRRACRECAKNKTRNYRIRGIIRVEHPEFKKEYFKTEVSRLRAIFCSETLIMVMKELIKFCEKTSIPICFTETATLFSEDQKLKRVSSSHRDGRAFDFSVRGLSEKNINDVKEFLINNFGQLGAISEKTNSPTIVVDHDSGFGRHLHAQLRKDFAKNNIQKLIETSGNIIT